MSGNPPRGVGSTLGDIVRGLLVPLLAVFTAVAHWRPRHLGHRRRPPALEVAGWPAFLTRTGLWRPILAYMGLVEGAFGSPPALSETAVWATPYIFAGLAVALAFKGGLFNIGAEGQLALGALIAAWVGLRPPQDRRPAAGRSSTCPLAILVGALAGAVWGAIPAGSRPAPAPTKSSTPS